MSTGRTFDEIVSDIVAKRTASECRSIARRHREVATMALTREQAEFAASLAAAWDRMAADIEGESK